MRLLIVALAMAVSTAAWAQPREFGSYEREALTQALERRGLEIEPDPSGKVLGTIHVVNVDVFGPREGFLQWLNVFHITTREEIIRREVLLRPGDTWDDDVVDDSRRRLRDPLFTSLVVMVPVLSAEPGKVDLLVVTRDIWSLRMNSNFEVQEQTLTALSLSLSENNFLGLRKQLAFVFAMDQGDFSLGPQYVDKNIVGSRLQLALRASALFARETGDFEGTSSFTSVTYPLWSLTQKWGADLTVRHFDGVVRLFVGNDLRTFDPTPETPGDDAVPWVYDYRTADVVGTATRSFGVMVKHNLSFGYELALRRPSVPGDFPGDAMVREAFEQNVLPRSELASGVFARYRFFINEFVTFRNIDSYDLPEERRIGPDFSADIGAATELLGSEVDFVRMSSTAGWTWRLGIDGLFRVAVGASGKLQSELIDNQLSGSATVVAPEVARAVRMVAEVNVARLLNDTNNRFFTLGGDSGLRGYPIGAFAGDALVRANVELRSLPLEVLFSQLGGLVFWDMGHAADTFGQLRLHHDVGLGIRFLVPQLQPFVFRLDWAVPLNGAAVGLGGSRVSAGVAQAF